MKKLLFVLFLFSACTKAPIKVGDCVKINQKFWDDLFNSQKNDQSRYFVNSLEHKCSSQVYKIINKKYNVIYFERNICAASSTINNPSEIFTKVSCPNT